MSLKKSLPRLVDLLRQLWRSSCHRSIDYEFPQTEIPEMKTNEAINKWRKEQHESLRMRESLAVDALLDFLKDLSNELIE